MTKQSKVYSGVSKKTPAGIFDTRRSKGTAHGLSIGTAQYSQKKRPTRHDATYS